MKNCTDYERSSRSERGKRCTAGRHNYSEAETRDYFIDLLLKEAGWAFTDSEAIVSFQLPECLTKTKEGFVDYVLWGDDGKPLAS